MKICISCGVFSGFSQPRKPIFELFVAKNRISSKRKEKKILEKGTKRLLSARFWWEFGKSADNRC